ncbi:hypothetical protein M1506_02840 [Patescibacteria group bacterium]|nr:hypothetical protein [Patescibacteria group bacterium]
MKKILLVAGLVLAPTLVLAAFVSWHAAKEIVPDDDTNENLEELSEMPAVFSKGSKD